MNQLVDTEVGIAPTDLHAQQLISAEKGYPKSGIPRTWLRPDADVPVLVVDQTGIMLTRDDGTSAPAHPIVVGSPAGGDLTGTYPNPTFSGASVDALIPPGTIWAYGGAGAPPGWLLCNGGAVSRTTYARLFAAIGDAYGPGDGTSTFNVPNLVGRVLLGVSGSHPLGQIGGAETVVGPPHTHPGTHDHDLAHTHPSHAHDLAHAHPSHDHDVGHTHPGSHSHGIATHAHSLNGHSHQTDLDHDHAVVASGKRNNDSVGALGFAEPAASSGTLDHHHNVDLAALGTLTVASAGPSTPNTNTAGTTTTDADTGAPAASPTLSGGRATATPSPAVDSGGQATATPSPAVTSGLRSTDQAALYPGSVATMMPYGTAAYIIRAGA